MRKQSGRPFYYREELENWRQKVEGSDDKARTRGCSKEEANYELRRPEFGNAWIASPASEELHARGH